MTQIEGVAIAKAVQGRLTHQTVFTAFEQLLGTPAYMSPDQALMTSADVDTRSDIYSLGVLLYERNEVLRSKEPRKVRSKANRNSAQTTPKNAQLKGVK